MKYTTQQILDKFKEVDCIPDLDLNTNYSVIDKISTTCSKHNTQFLQEIRYLFKGRVSCKNCATEKNSNRSTFKDTAVKIHNNKYDYSLVEYKTNNVKVKIICPVHGVFEQRPRTHISGHGCPFCAYKLTLIDKNFRVKYGNKIKTTNLNKGLENFKLKAQKLPEKLTINYDTYQTLRAKTLEVTCADHGLYITRPASLLVNLNGCPKCTENLTSHSLSNFIQICKRNSRDTAILYVLRIYSDSETFYKIGITSSTINRRYSSKSKLSAYDYEVIQEISDNPEIIWKLEKQLLKIYKDYHYIPQIPFHGSLTECFKL